MPDCTPTKKRDPVFISYGRTDAREFADRLAADLQSRDYGVFLDQTDIGPGDSFEVVIEDGIRSSSVVFILPPWPWNAWASRPGDSLWRDAHATRSEPHPPRTPVHAYCTNGLTWGRMGVRMMLG